MCRKTSSSPAPAFPKASPPRRRCPLPRLSPDRPCSFATAIPICLRRPNPLRHLPRPRRRARSTPSAWIARKPRAAFVVGSLQRSPVQAEGLNISVFSPAANSATAQAYGEAVARIVGVFSAQFGPLPQPNLTVAQIPDGTVAGYAAPGLLLVSARHWTAHPDMRLLSNLAASQWWGDQVMAASPHDVWLTDGLARYSEALYIEQTSNREAMNHALEDYAVGALMYEDAAPIAEARRLAPLTSAISLRRRQQGRHGLSHAPCPPRRCAFLRTAARLLYAVLRQAGRAGRFRATRRFASGGRAAASVAGRLCHSRELRAGR